MVIETMSRDRPTGMVLCFPVWQEMRSSLGETAVGLAYTPIIQKALTTGARDDDR